MSNVIPVDFGRKPFEIPIQFEILYADERVALARVTMRFGNEVIVNHFMHEAE